MSWPEGYRVNEKGALCYGYANNREIVVAGSGSEALTLLSALAAFLQGAR